MTSRRAPVIVVIAFVAFTISLARGTALAQLTFESSDASATPALNLTWPATTTWPLTLATATVTFGDPPPAAGPASVDGHGVATTIAGVSAATFVLLQGVDIAQTMRCIGAASCHEVNPFLRSLAREPAAFGATKMAIAFVSGYALLHERGRHPKLVTALSIAGIGLYATITYRQARFNRR